MPSDFAFKAANTLHRALVTVSGGRLGTKLIGMPVLELTTIGRKSGQPRTVMLTTPLQEGDTIVVVGSRGGDPVHPAWVHNIRDNPDVEVKMHGSRRKMKAHVADADERARLWPQITSKFKNYADYQTKTTREIPLVLLDPA
jgi:deazaflavin-dependent oxidoreductase (nitroreductase family)